MQVSGYYPPHVGGVEFVTQNISLHLAAQGIRVTVLTSSIGGPDDEPTPPGVRIRRLRAAEFAHTPVLPTLPIALWREARSAVIHVHLGHVYTDLISTLVAVLRRRPLVCHFYMDVPASGPLGFLLQTYKRVFLGRVLRRADAVIALSDEQRELVVSRYRVPPARAHVIPNGVADEFFSARSPTRDRGPLRLLYVGRFAAQKNLPLLLETVARLDGAVRLDLVGDGELREEVRARARPLGDAVRMWGSLSGAHLAERYREADVFVLTSDREGMPLALLEAMAAGLAVVASDVQGLRESVQDVGLLVSDRSASGFGAALRTLIDDPELLRRLGAASRQAAESRRWDPLVGRILEIYRVVGGSDTLDAPRPRAVPPPGEEQHDSGDHG